MQSNQAALFLHLGAICTLNSFEDWQLSNLVVVMLLRALTTTLHLFGLCRGVKYPFYWNLNETASGGELNGVRLTVECITLNSVCPWRFSLIFWVDSRFVSMLILEIMSLTSPKRISDLLIKIFEPYLKFYSMYMIWRQDASDNTSKKVKQM